MKRLSALVGLILQVAIFTAGNNVVSGQETTTTLEPVASVDEPSSLAETLAPEDATSEQGLGVNQTEKESLTESGDQEPYQTGPMIDLFGTKLQSLEMLNETSGQITEHYTNELLQGKNVIGIYFSADWCGPCRQFTPELVKFYERMNQKRGKKGKFQIIWVSRCRDVDSHYRYFSHMPWLALPPEEALGPRGEVLSNKYSVKGIPTLVLVDDLGQTITTDARNKIPQDKAGIGFPWRNPLAHIYHTVFPRPLRMMVKMQVDSIRTKVIHTIKSMLGVGKK